VLPKTKSVLHCYWEKLGYYVRIL